MTTASEEKREEFRREARGHLDALWALGLRLTGGDASEAEELVRETLRTAYRSWDDYRAGTHCGAWLAAILRNRFVGEHRREHRRSEPVADDELEHPSALREPGDADPEADVFDRLEDREVVEAVEALEDALRVPVVLADLEGLAYQEIADLLDVRVDTVESRLSGGRRRLREELRRVARGRAAPGAGADDRSTGDPPARAAVEGAGEGRGAPGGLPCREALEQVYAYLDGELDPETQERIHRHVETCQRCYPIFDLERLFLDAVRERGLATGDAETLRGRPEGLLDRVG